MVAYMQTITVFGATGTIGVRVVERALERGLTVRAFARRPMKLPFDLRNQVDLYHGDVTEPTQVEKAVKGADAVVITLGNRNNLSPTTTLSEGTINIINAMKKYHVTTLSVCLSLFLFPEEPMPIMFTNITEDHQRMYEALKKSPLNYIAIFSPHFNSSEAHGDLIVTVNKRKSPGESVSETLLGKFLVDSLFDSTYYRAVIGLSSD